MENTRKELESEKQDLLKLADDVFGKNYFETLDRLISDYANDDEQLPQYVLTVNYEGAFHASEK